MIRAKLQPQLVIPYMPEWSQDRFELVKPLVTILGSALRTNTHQCVLLFLHEYVSADLNRDPHKFSQRAQERLRTDPRVSVHRALTQAIEFLQYRPWKDVLSTSPSTTWDFFIKEEGDFLKTQLILLWFDLLWYARICHQEPNEPVILNSELMPIGRTPAQPHTEETLGLHGNISWEDEFTRLLAAATCLPSHKTIELKVALASTLKHAIAGDHQPFILMQEKGCTLAIQRHAPGQYSICPIPPMEHSAWTARHRITFKKNKVAFWQYTCQRLVYIHEELGGLEDQSSHRAMMLISIARELLGLLHHSCDLPTSSLSTVRKTLETIGPDLGYNQTSWVQEQLDSLFCSE